MYEYNKLRAKIVEVYGSMANFHEEECDKLCISYVSMSKKMSGKSRFSQDDIEIWRNLLGISTDEIGLYFFT